MADDFERDAARRCREFHGRAGPSPRERRPSLAEFARGFYANRLRVQSSAGQRTAIDDLEDADCLAIEMAHDGQLPHLGIVRLVLKAHDIAGADGQAVTLYLVGNHYTPAMRPDNIRFGMPLKGAPPDEVKHPPKVRVGKASAHIPFRWLPPPRGEELARLRDQIHDFIRNNVTEAEKVGLPLESGSEARMRQRLAWEFELLTAAAAAVESFGDWLVRAQHDLFHAMLGGEADRILFLPMADLTDLLRSDLAAIAVRADAVARIKAKVSAEQKGRGEEPYLLRGSEPSPFWVYCPSCRRRRRTAWTPGSQTTFACPTCGHRTALSESDFWRWAMPDIVAYESALFRLGIDGWVVGSHASYHPVIESVHHEVFGSEAPPRFFQTSVPVFRGVGEPEGGDRRSRLLRVLLETEPAALAKALRAPWSDDPVVRSDAIRK